MKLANRHVALLFPLLIALSASAAPPPGSWPSWRGPLGTGVAPQGDPPTEWSETKNVKWKVALPGRGHATPVVWGDHIFVTSAISSAAAPPPAPVEGGRPGSVHPSGTVRFVVLALDRKTGKVLWERTAREAVPHEGTHADGTWASASPVTDGELVYAQFGSHGLYAYDVLGNLKWSKDLGDMKTRNAFGEGSSPALAGSALIVNWDHEGEDFIVALDKKTGEERWRKGRDEPTSWSTPFVIEHGGKTQVIVAATNQTRSYDAATGEVLWQLPGMTLNTIPTPVASDGLVFLMSGFRGNMLQAVRLAEAKGDLAGTPAVAWTYDRDTPYVPSPVLAEGILYFLKSNTGTLSALDAKTGAVKFGPVRLNGIEGVYASLVAASGRVYVVGREGTTAVLKAGAQHEVLATNTLEDRFDSSPAVAGDELLLRGSKHLYALARLPEAEKPAAAGTKSGGRE